MAGYRETIEVEVSSRSMARVEEMLQEMRELAAEVKAADYDSRQLLTVSQVAKRLQVSESWVYKQIRRMDRPLPALNEGGVIRVHPGKLENWALNDRALSPATSEERYGIVAQPEPTCHAVDPVLDALKDAESRLKGWDRMELDDLKKAAEYAEWYIDRAKDELENVRQSNGGRLLSGAEEDAE